MQTFSQVKSSITLEASSAVQPGTKADQRPSTESLGPRSSLVVDAQSPSRRDRTTASTAVGRSSPTFDEILTAAELRSPVHRPIM